VTQRRMGVGGYVWEKEKNSRLENGLRHLDVPMLSWISQDSMEKKTQPAGFVERSSFSDSKEGGFGFLPSRGRGPTMVPNPAS